MISRILWRLGLVAGILWFATGAVFGTKAMIENWDNIVVGPSLLGTAGLVVGPSIAIIALGAVLAWVFSFR